MSSSGSDGIVGPETARAIGTGRESIGVVLRAAQERLQHVFIAFVVGLLGGIFLMRLYIWPQLEADLLAAEAQVIAQTPFDVILMQVKIGLFGGVAAAVPVLLYHAREPLRDRDIIPDVTVKRWHAAVVGLLCIGLATLGILYAYFLFFPLMFDFLAGNAVGAGLAPKYSIVKWTEFIFFLALSFALAAQLPLLMGALSYSGVVPYEVFRDKWKYAVMGIFAFGAFFSPPDPFTQILWATPLILLYGLSLYISKILVTMKRGREHVDVSGVFRERWNRILGVGVLGFAGGYAAGMYGAVGAFNDGLAFIGSQVRVPTVAEALGVPPETGYLLLGGLVAVLALVAAALYYAYVAVDRAARVVAERNRRPDPAAIDLDELDAAGVRGAPPEAFAALSEDEALATAQRALDDGDDEKAQLVLDRFDEIQAAAEEAAEAEDADEAAGDDSNPVQSTAAGMMDAFTDEETTEDDIGGYYYDIRFVLSSLRSRAFHIVGTFMVVMVALFGWLYYGGFGDLRDDFIARIPAEVQPEAAAWPITLHPVEALVFQVKLSVVIAAIAVLPMIVYYLWPALSDRGVVTGDRRTILVWGGSIVVALAAGSYLGYSFIAPEVISYLVYDALREGMVISYTVSTFAWLIFLLTVGIGLLADIPVTMVLFHVGGIVSFDTMRARWRVPVLAIFAASALLTPDSLYTMFVIALPMVAMYLVGLGLLYLVTLGGRRGGSGRAVGE
ncbi:Sec-independent protein translocase TatC [Halobacterium jilantaiense]|uniref:Sec-independent protein translocase protein TatC n=1 Tax=Halobacterium jilantaiense TaxID=355548 RepID=A0A1I0PUF9_9EURY|nr:Sec-independent protein translocase TatC [Halobacterium jilantaiense]SEW18097.1 sec-independent protein translocase protein TatC [Halobacterium jilantaiense]